MTGVGRHDRVLLQLPNRAEYPVAFHAVQRGNARLFRRRQPG